MGNAVVVSCASVIAYSRFDGHLTSERECLTSQQLSTVRYIDVVVSSVFHRVPAVD